MAQAMAACKNALVGSGTATATANGLFKINGCVLLFNGQPQSGLPTLKVFTRVQAANPATSAARTRRPTTRATRPCCCNGVLKTATGLYGKVLDVNHITQAASFPLTEYKTTVKHGSYGSIRCAAADHLWHGKVVFTYNNNTTSTVSKTQQCTVG